MIPKKNLRAFFCILMLAATGSVSAQTGVYTLNGGTASETDQTYAATLTDQSAVYVLNSGNLTLTNCIMTKTGDASDVNQSSQYGINAGVLAASSGKITISGGSVTTNASGGNGLFATGTGSSVTMSNGTISASGAGAHGIDATYGGSVTLTNVNITTTGASSSALATDFGGGTVNVTGGTIIAAATASGSHSAGIYSTGIISVADATVSSSADCGGVIDGANSIILSNTTLTGSLHGIKTWKTAPMSGTAAVTITGGSLVAQGGDAFYVTGETGNSATASFTVSGGATITASTGNIVNVISSSTATFTGSGEILNGNFNAESGSTLSLIFQNSVLTGSAQNTGITLDAASSWILTANSVMTTVIDPSGISGTSVTNITGNGFSAHYDSTLAANAYLGGLTYSLLNGGFLTPGNVLGIDDQTLRNSGGCQLYQNYPNPVSNITTIVYRLSEGGFVTMKIVDHTGRELASPVGSEQEAGEHSIHFDASQLAGGLYFCLLQSNGETRVRRLVIAK